MHKTKTQQVIRFFVSIVTIISMLISPAARMANVLAEDPPAPHLKAIAVKNQVELFDFTANSSVQLTVAEGENTTLFDQPVVMDDHGYAEQVFSDFGLVPGMTITASEADNPTNTKVLELANLTLGSVDLETNTIAGIAPINTEFDVYAGYDDQMVMVTTTSDGAGLWTASFTTLSPGMNFNAIIQDGDGDQTFAMLAPAYIEAWLDGNRISGNDWPLGDLTLEIFSDGGSPLYSVTQTINQQSDDYPRRGYVDFDLSGHLELSAGMKVTMSMGQTIRRTTIMALDAPTIDVDTDTLSGTATTGAHIWACVDTPDGCVYRDATAQGVDGSYVLDYGHAGEGQVVYDLGPGDHGGLNWDDGMNNHTSRGWGIPNPSLRASLDNDWVQGWDFTPDSYVTVAIVYGEDTQTFTPNTDDGGHFFLDGNDTQVNLLAGTEITVTDGVSGAHKSLTVTNIAATSFDLANSTISGSGPNNQKLEVCTNTENDCAIRVVTADENDGKWTTPSFAVESQAEGDRLTATFALGETSGWVALNDEDGDATQIDWYISRPNIEADYINNWIETRDWWTGTEVYLMINEDDTHILSATVAHNDGNSDPNDIRAHFDVADLQIGDDIEISNADRSIIKTLTVSALEITSLGTDTGIITGTSGAFNANLEVCVNTDHGCVMRRIQSTGEGAWTANFTIAGSELQADEQETMTSFPVGTNGWAAVSDNDGDRIHLDWNVPEPPAIQASLVNNWIQGDRFAPNSTITITIGAQVFDDISTDADGHFWFNGNDQEHGVDLVPGMAITAADTDDNTRELILDALTLDSFDVAGNELKGTAVNGKVVHVTVGNENTHETMLVTAANGLWSADFGEQGFDILVGMGYDVYIEDSEGDRTVGEMTAAHIDAWIDSNDISGFEWPVDVNLTMVLADSQGELLYSATKTTTQQDPNDFTRGLADFHVPDTIPLQADMQVTMTTGNLTRHTVILPLGAPVVSEVDDTISGSAAVGARIWACVDTPDGCISRSATIDDQGKYLINYEEEGEGKYDLKPGDHGGINWEDGLNNQTSRGWYIPNPNLNVNLDDQRVVAWDWAGGSELYLKIGEDDWIGPVTVGPADWDDQAIVGQFNLDADSLHANDTITVRNADDSVSRTMTILTVSNIEFDLNNALISGNAQSGLQIEVGVNQVGAMRVVTVDDENNWQADFATLDENNARDNGQTDKLEKGWDGWIATLNDHGDRVEQGYHIPDTHLDAWLNNSSVSAYDFPAGANLTLSILDQESTLYYTSDLRTDEKGFTSFQLPAGKTLQPGQTITVTDGDVIRTLVLANFDQPVLDIANNSVSGTAATGARIWTCLMDNINSCVYRFTDVGVEGTFQFNFNIDDGSGSYRPFRPGDFVGVNWDDGDGDNTSWGLGISNYWIQVEPAQNAIFGFNWPEGDLVTVTVEDPQTHAQVTGEHLLASSENDCDGDICFTWFPEDWTLAPGQVVTASDGVMETSLTIAPLVVTRVDLLHDQIAGEADANSTVIVKIGSQGDLARQVVADADGNWLADFSQSATLEETVADLTMGDVGGSIQPVSPERILDGTVQAWEAVSPILLSGTSVRENVPGGSVVGTFSPRYDLDGQNLAYSLVAGADDNASFSITGDSLMIAVSPNYELKSSYTIRVQVEDLNASGKTDEEVFTIQVEDVVEGPQAFSLDTQSISENILDGTVVGEFSVDEPVGGMTYTYSLVAGDGADDNDQFSIIGELLAINISPDYEAKQSYSIRVRVTDSDTPQNSLEEQFTISVTDVNEAPTAIHLSAISIDENAGNNVVVGTFSADDPDIGQNHTYQFVAGDGDEDNGDFSIDGSTLKINVSPNFEVKNSYAIRVQVSDEVVPALTYVETFTINVNDVNDAPDDIYLSNADIDENVAPDSLVGTFTTSDDESSQTHTYQLVSGTGSSDNGSFSIGANGELYITVSPNYEAKSTYSIRVRTTDSGSGNLTFEKAFTITIHDLNEAPSNLALSATSINENVAAGSLVGTLSATDPDSEQTLHYSLVAGTGSDDNAAFTITSANLTINASPDYESKNSFAIRVRVQDDGVGQLSMEQALTITVNNLNDAPTNISLSAANIAENSAAGSEIGTLSATDQDAGQTFVYSLVSGAGSVDNAAFTINGSSLRIKASPDYETKSSYAIRIKVTDSGSPAQSFEKAFTITVTNLVEPPVVVSFSKSGLQDSPIGFTATDFSEHFVDPESSSVGALTKIQISAIPSHGSLKLNGGAALALNTEIAVENLGQLDYVPNANYSGSDSFSWKGADSNGYSTGSAQVSLTIGFVARYGLQVNPLGDAKTVKAGTAATYNLALTNTGNTSDSYTVALVGTPTWTTSLSTAQVSNLGVNAQANIAVTVNVPANTNGSSAATVKITSTHDASKTINVVLTTTGTYTPPPPPSPVLLSVSPASVNLSAILNAQVTLAGANFTDPMTVKFGSTASASVTRNSSIELAVRVPSGLTAGVYTVQVCNASAVCTSLPGALTVLDNNPLVNNVYPRQGYNDTQNVVLVQGYNLNATTTLSLVGAAADKQPVGVTVSGSQLQATIPAGLPAGTYDLQACNQALCATLSGAYTSLDVIKNDFSASDEDLWTAPATIREGNTINLGLNVHRSSGIGLASAQVAFYVDDPSLPANRISPEINPSTSEMAVGSVESVMATWTPEGLSGTVKIYAVIDPDGFLTEATRANNTVSTTIQILPRQEEDETAPVIASLSINSGSDFTSQKTVSLNLQASDNSGADGIKMMNLVERQFNTSARQWVVVQETGWIAYQAAYSLTLADQGGMHYVQVWVADGAGNTSEMAQAHINYLPSQESISAGSVRIYRLNLSAGDEKFINLTSVSGDADIYVWDEDGNLIASSLTGDPIDHVGLAAPVDGMYQIEVYAYSDATYEIDFDAPAAGPLADAEARISDIQDKTPRSQPAIVTQNEPLKSIPTETAPIEAQQEDYFIYLPVVVR
jgi:hypothetical protein